jgi:hypothetical protein
MPDLHSFLPRLGGTQVEDTEDDAPRPRGLGVYDRPERKDTSLRIIVGLVLLVLLVTLTFFLIQQMW